MTTANNSSYVSFLKDADLELGRRFAFSFPELSHRLTVSFETDSKSATVLSEYTSSIVKPYTRLFYYLSIIFCQCKPIFAHN